VLTTSGSKDGERMSQHNNTSSIMLIRLSDLNSGRTMPWKSNPTADQPTFISHQALTQDGGNSSNIKMVTLLTRKQRSLKFKETLMLRIETSLLETRMVRSISNGM